MNELMKTKRKSPNGFIIYIIIEYIYLISSLEYFTGLSSQVHFDYTKKLLLTSISLHIYIITLSLIFI